MNQEITLIDKLLITLINKKGSDLHITSEGTNFARIKKEMVAFPDNLRISNRDIMTWIKSVSAANNNFIKDESISNIFVGKGDLDFSYEIQSIRFRVHVYCSSGGKGAIAFRRINTEIPNLEDLRLPSFYKDIANYPQGLILITGSTGSGKSTTIASLIETVNLTHRKHIVTLEEPIEFVFTNKLSLIHQKEVGRDILSFQDGVKSIFREDPDVILVGEIRDKDEAINALTLASSGHVVLATLHTSGVMQTFGRLFSLFEGSDLARIRGLLQDNLKCIINQSLYKTNKDDIIPLYEHLFINKNTIRVLSDKMDENQIKQILDGTSNKSPEMMTYRWQSIMRFFQNGDLDVEEARRLVELFDMDKLQMFEAQKGIVR